MFLELKDAGRRYGRTWAVRGLNLRVESGEFFGVVGPSGAGKTTLLNLVAGFAPPSQGAILCDPAPGPDNPVIMVHQDYLLFPHLNVRQNVAFGLEARNLARTEIERRAGEMLEYFRIADKAEAYPAHLSAGQRQRVALARAMAVRPGLLLLDEPFANLDPRLRAETAEFIRSTQKSFGVTTLCVTHDLTEACLMSERIGVMLDGALVRTGRAADVFAAPGSDAVAEFLGPLNRIPSDLARHCGLADADAPSALNLRPEEIGLTPDPQGPGLVAEAVFAATHIRYVVTVRDARLIVHGPPPGLAPGQRVSLHRNSWPGTDAGPQQ